LYETINLIESVKVYPAHFQLGSLGIHFGAKPFCRRGILPTNKELFSITA